MGIFLKPCEPLEDYPPVAQFNGYFQHPEKHAFGDDHLLSHYTLALHVNPLDF